MNRLEKALIDALSAFKLSAYPTGGNQVRLQDLVDTASPQEHLEFDAVFLSGRTCVLVEITEDASNNRKKARRFLEHCEIFRNSSTPIRDRFRLLGLSAAKAKRFEDVEDWRYLYIGAAPELREKNLRSLPVSSDVPQHTILWDEDWAYLQSLKRDLGWLGRNELFAALDLTPGHESDSVEAELTPRCIRLPARKLGRTLPKADLYMMHMGVENLLKMCRVLRYQHFPLSVETGTAPGDPHGYQRMLSREKLEGLRRYVGNNPAVAFPSPIVLFATKCETSEDGAKVRLPLRYASLDVIDGQHRLFAFAKLAPKVQREAQLLVTIVHFRDASESVANRYAASTFITINRNQAKVKRELIILASFDALNDHAGEAIAGKILQQLNEASGLLFGRLRVRPLARARSKDKRLLRIVTIALEIAPLVQKTAFSESPAARKHLLKLGGTSKVKFEDDPSERVRVGVALMKRYLNLLQHSFLEDLEKESDSYLMTPVYLAAFIRRFASYVQEGRNWVEIDKRIKTIKMNARKKSKSALAFPRACKSVPELKKGITKITAYLRSCERRRR